MQAQNIEASLKKDSKIAEMLRDLKFLAEANAELRRFKESVAGLVDEQSKPLTERLYPRHD